ncbi:NDP-sugar synthase [Pseudomonadota bacterium]|nr:NDP-sugar synthase [Pseudomonadota bacterium]
MKAVILCAGLGSRMGKQTKDCPKPLLKVNNLTIIEWQIIFLKKAGVKEIFINTHYLAKKIMEYLKDGDHLGVKIKYIFQKKLNGTGGGIKIFEKDLKNEIFFFVLYGDILTNENFNELIDHHVNNDAECTIYCHERKNSNSLLHFNDNTGLINDFIERPTSIQRDLFINKYKISKHYANSCIYLMAPSVFSYIPENLPFDIPKNVFAKIIEKKKMYALPIKKTRYAIDTIEKYHNAKSYFKGNL